MALSEPHGVMQRSSWLSVDLGNAVCSDWIPPWRMGGGPWRLHVTGEMCVFPHVPVPLLVRLLQTSAGSDALTVCDRARETSKECAHEQD